MVGSEEGDGWMNKSKVTNRCSWINKEIDFSMGQVLPPSATLFILVTTLPETTDICKRWSTDMQILHNFLDANDNLTINRFMDSEQKWTEGLVLFLTEIYWVPWFSDNVLSQVHGTDHSED